MVATCHNELGISGEPKSDFSRNASYVMDISNLGMSLHTMFEFISLGK